MTGPQYDSFCADIDALCEKHGGWMRGDYNLDSLMLAIADCVKREAALEKHPRVIDCLIGCARRLEHAAMDYYVSTK